MSLNDTCLLPPIFAAKMRARRPLLALGIALVLTLLFARHILPLIRIMSVYIFWPFLDGTHNLSKEQNNFDTTFQEYPIRQWSAHWPPIPSIPLDSPFLQLANGSFASPDMTSDVDVVPPILHHILLGKPQSQMPLSWEASRQTCLECVYPLSIFCLLRTPLECTLHQPTTLISSGTTTKQSTF
jgi:hypothetical protein